MDVSIGFSRARRAAARRALRVSAIVLAMLSALGAVGATSAAARSAPIPSCGWAPASMVGEVFGDPVRMMTPEWTTVYAPLLTCGYAERQPKLQLGDAPIVAVRFAENQRFAPDPGSTFVRRLGKCVNAKACPRPNKAAWMYVQMDRSGSFTSDSQFVSEVDLRVQDGLNAIEIFVSNPYGPLAVASESAQAQRLARLLLPKFYWAGNRTPGGIWIYTSTRSLTSR